MVSLDERFVALCSHSFFGAAMSDSRPVFACDSNSGRIVWANGAAGTFFRAGSLAALTQSSSLADRSAFYQLTQIGQRLALGQTRLERVQFPIGPQSGPVFCQFALLKPSTAAQPLLIGTIMDGGGAYMPPREALAKFVQFIAGQEALAELSQFGNLVASSDPKANLERMATLFGRVAGIPVVLPMGPGELFLSAYDQRASTVPVESASRASNTPEISETGTISADDMSLRDLVLTDNPSAQDVMSYPLHRADSAPPSMPHVPLSLGQRTAEPTALQNPLLSEDMTAMRSSQIDHEREAATIPARSHRLAFALDQHHRFTQVEGAVTAFLGVTADALIGRSLAELAKAENFEPTGLLHRLLTEQKLFSDVKVTWEHTNGTQMVPAEVTGVPMHDLTGAFQGVRGFILMLGAHAYPKTHAPAQETIAPAPPPMAQAPHDHDFDLMEMSSPAYERPRFASPTAATPEPAALEHPPIRLNQPDRQAAAQAFDSGAISDRPDVAIRSESALAPIAMEPTASTIEPEAMEPPSTQRHGAIDFVLNLIRSGAVARKDTAHVGSGAAVDSSVIDSASDDAIAGVSPPMAAESVIEDAKHLLHAQSGDGIRSVIEQVVAEASQLSHGVFNLGQGVHLSDHLPQRVLNEVAEPLSSASVAAIPEVIGAITQAHSHTDQEAPSVSGITHEAHLSLNPLVGMVSAVTQSEDTQANDAPSPISEPVSAPILNMPIAPRATAFGPYGAEGGPLSKREVDAFQQIAEALGARYEGSTSRFDQPLAPITATIASVQSQESDPTFAEDVAWHDGPQPLPLQSPPVLPPREAALIEKIPLALLITRAGEAIYANKAFFDLTGHENIASFQTKGGVTGLLSSLPTADHQPPLVVHKEGHHVPAQVHMVPVSLSDGAASLVILRHPATEASSVVAFPTEGEGNAARSSLAEAKARELEGVVRVAADAVFTVDHHGVILNANQASENLFGQHRDALVGRSLTDVFAPAAHGNLAEQLHGVSSPETDDLHISRSVELWARNAAGIEFPVAVGMGRTTPDKIAVAVRDLTFHKSHEASLLAAKQSAESANRQKTDFLAKISHEVRTPLNAIIGFSEVMMEERFGPIGNDRYRQYVRDIHNSGSHIMSLVNDLLDISKIEAGKMDLQIHDVDVNAVMRECVGLIQAQANRDRIVLRIGLTTDTPHVLADRRSLRQILLNLLSNAVKFTKSGGQVIVSTQLEENGDVSLRVRDTGIGMSPDDIRRAMEPFAQIDPSKPGTGLGLPLTKTLVEANRAVFRLDSVVNAGTLAQVIFPRDRVIPAV